MAAAVVVVTVEAAEIANLEAVAVEEDAVVAEEIAGIDTKSQLQHLILCLERQGLVYLGSVSPDTSDDFEKYQEWLQSGNHGQLTYLELNSACRKSAQSVMASTQSVIVFGLPYTPNDVYPLLPKESPRVAAYARIPDYHVSMKKQAEMALAKWKKKFVEPAEWRVCVDTVPILERAFAKNTGTGFIGKNTCFIHSTRGSFLLLGEILSSLPFEKSKEQAAEGCGSCTLCQVECPTGALQKDYQMDAKKCVSYWTIEQRGPIPEEFWPAVGKYWFGCDICQLVCPFNKEAESSPAKTLSFPSLFEVATMNEAQYKKYFGGTALTRAKRNGLRRNALIAMTVTGDPSLPKALSLSLSDCDSPIQETLEQIKSYLARFFA